MGFATVDYFRVRGPRPPMTILYKFENQKPAVIPGREANPEDPPIRGAEALLASYNPCHPGQTPQECRAGIRLVRDDTGFADIEFYRSPFESMITNYI